jgi:hypothetical protein
VANGCNPSSWENYQQMETISRRASIKYNKTLNILLFSCLALNLYAYHHVNYEYLLEGHVVCKNHAVSNHKWQPYRYSEGAIVLQILIIS